MLSFTKFPLACLVISAQYVLAMPQLFNRQATCTPLVLTKQVTMSMTVVESYVTVPHPCYTYTATTAQSNNSICGVFNTQTCGPAPACIFLSTTTLTVPASDPCCTATPTVTVGGACATCITGCATSTETIYESAAPSAAGTVSLQAASATTSASCTTTLMRGTNLGPVKTEYPSTSTVTEAVDCQGCALDVQYPGPPPAGFTSTTTVSTPATMTAYECKATSSV